jgi:hypothetical protein
VRDLQIFLFNYYGLNMNPTGFYGPTTKKLVTQLQQEQGLYPITGGVGPLTRAAITRICGGGIVGGDRDEHGCIGSAGYSWYAVKNKCLRTWEENCGKDQAFCTAIYQPVCGMQNNNQLKTFGNSCELNNAGAKYLYDGECKNNQTNEAPANCKIWYDGCNTCSRSSVGGPLMCTMMACLNNTNNGIWNSGAYCKEYFTNSIETPTIKSFSGPVQLRVNETGTWKVEASTFNNQQLTYNITWGDEKYDYKIGASVLPYINSVFPQNTTFEHTYAYPGNYTVTVTVTAANGQSTKSG